MYGYHYEMAKSIAEGRREQVRKSAVQTRKAMNMVKKKRRKGTVPSFMKII
ncbi:hypothetical protein ACDX78_13070 [Virgibacillus oceani]